MEDKENPSLHGTPVINTPSGSKDPPGTSKGTPIRPLTAAYRSARSENEVQYFLCHTTSLHYDQGTFVP